MPDATAPLAHYLRRARQRLGGSPEPAPEPGRASRRGVLAGLLPLAALLCCCCAVAAALLLGGRGVRLSDSGNGRRAFSVQPIDCAKRLVGLFLRMSGTVTLITLPRSRGCARLWARKPS